MRTPYNESHAAFSEQAHCHATTKFYPTWLSIDAKAIQWDVISFSKDDRSKALDGDMAIDRIARISIPPLPFPIAITIQERFRTMKFIRYNDITITLYNSNSNIPSELSKLMANFFVYGIYDDHNNTLRNVRVLNVPRLIGCVICGLFDRQLEHPRHNEKNQAFVAFPNDQLRELGIIVYEYNEPD